MIRRLVLALLVAAIGAGAVVMASGWIADDARALAREQAEAEADRRADAYERTSAALDRGEPVAFARELGDAFDVTTSPPSDHDVVRRITIPWEGGTRDVVLATRYTAPAREPSRRTLMLAAGTGLLLAIFALLLGGAAPRVDRKLEAAARRVGEGDLDVTLDGSSPTASAFNRMTRELRDARNRLARAERIAAWRDIARRIAHEIKNPLTPIKMAMETLRKTHARKHPDFDEIFDESTKTVLEETARLERIVTEFSRFARMPRPKAESLDVTDVVEKVVSMHDLPAAAATLPEAAKGVRVELVKDDRLPRVRADAEQLTQVMVNLVQNACDAAREKQGDVGGRVIVRLERAESDGVRIVVSDNGPGIPSDARNAVLEPYYTTKVHGTGLGLAIVDRIVSDHGGSVTLGDDAELGGAAVSVVLRREGPSDEPESSAIV